VPETRAQHRAAVAANHALREHDLAVARNHVRWQHDQAVAANHALHAREVAYAQAVAAHEAVLATERQAQAARDAAQRAASSKHAAPPAATVTRPAMPIVSSGQSRVGAATWYAWRPGQCASPFLPHGTMLTVTDLATGKTIQCLVTDTEADNVGRVVDLSEYCFEELGSLSQGVIEVRVSW
jgi:rare lipoprotein A (peptidoglycan hydrolase)